MRKLCVYIFSLILTFAIFILSGCGSYGFNDLTDTSKDPSNGSGSSDSNGSDTNGNTNNDNSDNESDGNDIVEGIFQPIAQKLPVYNGVQIDDGLNFVNSVNLDNRYHIYYFKLGTIYNCPIYSSMAYQYTFDTNVTINYTSLTEERLGYNFTNATKTIETYSESESTDHTFNFNFDLGVKIDEFEVGGIRLGISDNHSEKWTYNWEKATDVSNSFVSEYLNTYSKGFTENIHFSENNGFEKGYWYRVTFYENLDAYGVLIYDLETETYTVSYQEMMQNGSMARVWEKDADNVFEYPVTNQLKFDVDKAIEYAEKNRLEYIVYPSGFVGGDGTKEKPYAIKNIEQFNLISKYDSENTYFKLVDDIDFYGCSFLPLQSFKGTLDGNSRYLKNWSCNSDTSNTALIISNEGTLKNIKICNFSVKSEYRQAQNHYTAAFVGLNKGLIDNCYIENSLVDSNHNHQTETSDYLNSFSAALVSYNVGSGTVKNCFAYNCNIKCYTNIAEYKDSDGKAWAKAGAVVGYNAGTVTSCYATENTVNSITRGGKFWTGNPPLLVSCSGGVVGFNINGGIVEFSFATNNELLTENITAVGKTENYGYKGQIAAQNSGNISRSYYLSVETSIGKQESSGTSNSIFEISSIAEILKNIQMTSTYGWHIDELGRLTPCEFKK